MDIVLFKLLAGGGLFLFGIFFALVPYILISKVIKSEEKAKRILSLGNALSGGIFFGGGLIHMLHETTELFEELEIHFVIPLSELLCGFGFFLVFFLEKVLFLVDTVPLGDRKKIPKDDVESEELESGKVVELEEIDLESTKEEKNHLHVHDGGQIEKLSGSGVNSILPFLLMGVLSLHSVIAGFALGIQHEIGHAYGIFFAVISHKWIESFALGTSLLRSKVTPKVYVRCILFYAVTLPIGILIGLLLSLVVDGRPSVIMEAIVTGVASGTFIYISLVDILLEEFRVAKDKFLKFGLTILGFTLISLSVLLFHDH